MIKIKNIRILAMLMFFMVFQQGFSQEKIYLDKNWKETTQENASFYRISKKEKENLFYIKDYYINGNLQMDGHFSDLEKETLHGTINWYSESGQKTITKNYKYGTQVGEEIMHLSNGSTIIGIYKDGEPYEGVFYDACTCCSEYPKYQKGKQISKIKYYRNTNQIAIEEFIDKDYNIIKIDYYNKNNQKSHTLFYEEYSKKIYGTELDFYKENREITTIKSKRTYADGKLHGEEITYDRKGNIWLKGTYVLGDKYDGYFIDGLAKEQYKKGIQIGERVQYDADFNNIGNVTYQSGKPYQGVLYKYAYETHYNKGRKVKKIAYYDDERTMMRNTIEYTNKKNSKIDWYDKQGAFLGTGYYINDKIDKGFHWDWEYRHSLYENGMKNGIEKEFDSDDDTKSLALKTKIFYKNDTIIWKKTLKPNAKKFHHCDFKNAKPYEGAVFNYTNEKFYEKGVMIRENQYDKDFQTGKLTISTEDFYNVLEGEHIKRNNYKNGQSYVIEYKEGKPYNGRAWYYDHFLSFKNGEIEGPYAYFEKGKVIEKGNFVGGEKQGFIHFTPLNGNLGDCEFKNNKPQNGNTSTQNENTFYVGGKKHGDCIIYFDANLTNQATKDPEEKKDKIITTYNKGVKIKEVAIIKGIERLEGVFKDEKPYNGAFYVSDKKAIERYKDGERHIENISFIGGSLKFIVSYNKGYKEREKVIHLPNNYVMTEGRYKNNKPYNGTFLSKNNIYEEYEGYEEDKEVHEYLLTPYEKARKNGIETTLSIYGSEITETAHTTYKKGRKYGCATFLDSSNPEKNIKKKGLFKKGKPYDGIFLVSGKNIKITSNYKKGKKQGYEKYIIADNNTIIDSLYYENGKIIHGVKAEYVNKSFFMHHYANSKKEKIIITSRGLSPDLTIYPKDMGFEISFERTMELGYNTVKVVYLNKEKKAGKIIFISDNKEEFLEFAGGKFISGHISGSGYDTEFSMFVEKNKEIVVRLKEVSTYYTDMILENKIQKYISYYDTRKIINPFVMLSDSKPIKLKQYLEDGTFLAESMMPNDRKKPEIGTIIELTRGVYGEKFSYNVTHYPKDAKSKDDGTFFTNLSFKEMLNIVKKLKE